jgi:hypothetical protein
MKFLIMQFSEKAIYSFIIRDIEILLEDEKGVL